MPRKLDDKSAAYFSKQEFDTLQVLFEYLLKWKFPADPDVMRHTDSFYNRICELTAYKFKTIRNWYLPSGVQKISEYNLRYFCAQFSAVQKEIGDTKPDESEGFYNTFSDWINPICERRRWDIKIEKPPSLRIDAIKDNPSSSIDHNETGHDLETKSTFWEVENSLRIFTSEENVKNYRMLWLMISSDIKAHLCDGNFSEFCTLSFVPFKNVFLYNYNYLNKKKISCDFFAEAKVITVESYCVYLHQLRLRSDQMELFDSHLNGMLEMLHFDGIKNADKNPELPLVHVYENVLCYDIVNLFKSLGITTSNIYTVLPLTNSAYYKAFGQVSFVNENGQWLIGKFVPHDFLTFIESDYPFTWIPVRRDTSESGD